MHQSCDTDNTDSYLIGGGGGWGGTCITSYDYNNTLPNLLLGHITVENNTLKHNNFSFN